MATIAVGDVHGNLLALNDLLQSMLPTLSGKDQVVFLGDYIDKGPDSRGCVDRIITFSHEAPCPVVALLGNHEAYMLRTWRDWTAHSWIWIGGLQTIESYSALAAAQIEGELAAAGPRIVTEKTRINYGVFFDALPKSHAKFFATLKLYHQTLEVICVHAGVDTRPDATLAGTHPNTFTWGMDDFPAGYRGAQKVVYGHWDNSIEDDTGRPLPLQPGNRTFGLDTISKGVLTAMRVPGQQVWQSKPFK